MQAVAVTQIRDFKIRGNCFNRRAVQFRKNQPSSPEQNAVPKLPGYSPPVVDVELLDGSMSTFAVSECDIPRLTDEDADKAKRHLSLILEARQGQPAAAKELWVAAQNYLAKCAKQPQPSENCFVIPCTSTQPHSEREISHKAFTLLKLCQLGYPVPDFVVLSAQAYIQRTQDPEAHLADALKQLEILTGQSLGDAENPLVFAIRCATGHYLPGVMDTYLNVGVTERALAGLERMYGALAAKKMFLNNLRNLCRLHDPGKHAAVLRGIRHDLAPHEVDRALQQLHDIVAKTDRRLIEDPLAQARFFAAQAYKHFEDNQLLVSTLGRGTDHYPSLILQKMVCTVRDENAYAGVISSRHTQTGTGVELQTARNIFGEEMMTGEADIHSTAFEDRENIKEQFPAVYHFAPHLQELEREFEFPVTIEFAVEATRRHQWFALLQLNEAAMTGRAAFTAMVDLHKSGTISRRRVTELIRPYHIKQLTSDTIDQENFDKLRPFCGGVSVLPRSAVSARVYFRSETALQAKSLGEKVCLCKKTFVPTDTVVMREMDAILSLTSAAIHVVTICHSLGIPALLSLQKNGATLLPSGRLINADDEEINEGDWITLSSRRKMLYLGQAKFVPGRLLRYTRGEPIELDEEEREIFASVAYAYRYYQQLTKDLAVDQISTLNEVTRLVNFDLRGQTEEAGKLVNGWFDERETLYMEEVLKSDIGDHLGQSNVFEMLTLDRKIRFFKLALDKCLHDQISGYEAGAFMLGRFLCARHPTAFWKAFSPTEIGLLVNEWVMFEKYMQVLNSVGERNLLLARKEILKGGLEQLSLHPGYVQPLITLKLSGARLQEAKDSLPEWSDAQSARVLELLQQPYSAFYDFNAAWSVGQLETVCRAENLLLPHPNDV